VFEKVAAAHTVRPPWLWHWGVTASTAAHAAVVLAVASIPVPPKPPRPTVEAATFLVLLQAPRAPDTLSRLLADAEAVATAPPWEPASKPGGEGGEARPSIANLRLAFPGEAGAVPEIALVPTTFNRTADLQSLVAAAGTLPRGLRGRALLVGGGAADAGVISAELLAEPPRMVNGWEITRLLVRLYPRWLQATGVQGDVTLTFVIGRDGRVEMRSVKVVASAHPDLIEPTLRALAVMRFRPARLDGQPVRVRANLPVRWVLHGTLAQAP
jgi:TonB family protein